MRAHFIVLALSIFISSSCGSFTKDNGTPSIAVDAAHGNKGFAMLKNDFTDIQNQSICSLEEAPSQTAGSWIPWISFPDPGAVVLDRAEYLKREKINKIGSTVEYDSIMQIDHDVSLEYFKAGMIITTIFGFMGIVVYSQTKEIDLATVKENLS